MHFGSRNEYRFTVFKNCSSASSRIMFVDYSGPWQAQHDGSTHQRPYVCHPDFESSFSRDKFVEHSLHQLDRINTTYDENFYGMMDAIISYGTFYVADCSRQEVLAVLESEFDGLLAVNRRNATSSDPDHRGWDRPMGRTPQLSGPGRKKYYSSSFIQTGNPNIDRSRLQDFLKDKGFVLASEHVEYRLTLESNTAERQVRNNMMMALDKNFAPKYTILENHWLLVNIVSANKDSSFRPYDCRFTIFSYIDDKPQWTKPQSEPTIPTTTTIPTTLLRNDNDEVYGVDPDYRPRISFVRKRHTKIYCLEVNQRGAATNTFLDGMKIRIIDGTEYSRPSPETGEFGKIEPNRIEVTAYPLLPNLRDKDKMKTYFTECWKFAEILGSVLNNSPL